MKHVIRSGRDLQRLISAADLLRPMTRGGDGTTRKMLTRQLEKRNGVRELRWALEHLVSLVGAIAEQPLSLEVTVVDPAAPAPPREGE